MKSEDLVQGSSSATYAHAQPQAEFRVSLTLAITDTRALWTAAAARLLSASMTLDEVIDVIGPSEDPSTRDCLAALTKPDVLPGCVLDDFWIESVPASKSRPEHIRSALDRRPAATERPLRSLSVRPEVAPALHLGLPEALPSRRQVN
jgi:hypothetical protein